MVVLNYHSSYLRRILLTNKKKNDGNFDKSIGVLAVMLRSVAVFIRFYPVSGTVNLGWNYQNYTNFWNNNILILAEIIVHSGLRFIMFFPAIISCEIFEVLSSS